MSLRARPAPRWANERICPCQRQQVPLTPGTPHVSEHCDSQGLSSLGGRGTLLLVPRTLQCADWAKQCRQDHCLRRFVPRTPSCLPSSSAPLDGGTWNKPQGHRSQIRVWWRGSRRAARPKSPGTVSWPPILVTKVGASPRKRPSRGYR